MLQVTCYTDSYPVHSGFSKAHQYLIESVVVDFLRANRVSVFEQWSVRCSHLPMTDQILYVQLFESLGPWAGDNGGTAGR